MLYTAIFMIPLIIIAGPLAFFLICVYSVMKKMTLPGNLDIKELDKSMEEYNIHYVDYDLLNKMTEYMKEEGFDIAGDYFYSNNNIKSFSRFFRSSTLSIEGMINFMEGKSTRKITINFNTEFNNGKSLDTTSKIEPSVFYNKNLTVIRVPTYDWKRLLDIHKQNILNFTARNGITSVMDTSVSVTQKQERIHEDTIKLSIERGEIKYSYTEGVYRFTVKGALVAVFNMLKFKLTNRDSLKTDNMQLNNTGKIKDSENKRIRLLKTINSIGGIIVLIVLFSFARGTVNNYQAIFRSICIIVGVLAYIITNIMIKKEKTVINNSNKTEHY